MSSSISLTSLHSTIHAVAQEAGYPVLSDFQVKGLALVAQKKDVFIVAPTGSGKSVCFHLIPRLFRALSNLCGAIVVFSPIVWLIEDQIDRLVKSGEVASRLSGWTPEHAAGGSGSFLFLRPEELTKATLMQLQTLWQNVQLTAFVFDEAHCALHWGDSFREDYKLLKRRLSLFERIPRMAMTATASPETVKLMATYLGIPDAEVILEKKERGNMYLSLKPESEGPAWINRLVAEMTDQEFVPKTVIFRRERKGVVDLWRFLRNQLEREEEGLGQLVDMYTSSTSESVKRRLARDFCRADSKVRVLVATSAFGLGVDCRDLRRVVHLEPPTNFDEYVQAIGRAGRGGELAVAILFATSTARCDKALKDYIGLRACRRAFVEQRYFLNHRERSICCDICSK